MSDPVCRIQQAKTLRSLRGFTLLEVLVVLFIIGIIVSFAGLSVNQRDSRLVEDEARRLHGLLQIASEEAVFKGQELALQFNPRSYAFMKLEAEQWQALDEDRLLRERELPEGIELQLSLEGVSARLTDATPAPRIFLLSSGEVTPFELILAAPQSEKYLLRGDLSGKLELTKLDGDA